MLCARSTPRRRSRTGSSTGANRTKQRTEPKILPIRVELHGLRRGELPVWYFQLTTYRTTYTNLDYFRAARLVAAALDGFGLKLDDSSEQGVQCMILMANAAKLGHPDGEFVQMIRQRINQALDQV